jgi:hypothetical protein
MWSLITDNLPTANCQLLIRLLAVLAAGVKLRYIIQSKNFQSCSNNSLGTHVRSLRSLIASC